MSTGYMIACHVCGTMSAPTPAAILAIKEDDDGCVAEARWTPENGWAQQGEWGLS